MVPISIDRHTFDLLSLVADARVLYKKQAGTVDRRISRRKTSEQIYLEGMVAEYAVGTYLGVDPDFSISQYGDGGKGDLILMSGETIAVKHGGWTGSPFCLTQADIHSFRDDFGVLTWAVDPGDLLKGITIVGYITRDQLESRGYKHDFGYGERLCLDPWDLEPISELRRSHVRSVAS